MKYFLLLGAVFIVTISCFAQANFPSNEEVSDLMNKANEKVNGFEKAIEAAKPFIPQDQFAKDTDAAATAHQIINTLNKNGPTAYALVGLVITLDDLVIDAGVNSQDVLRDELKAATTGKPTNIAALSSVILLNASATDCLDISELIGHATLRFINVEETLLAKLMK